MRSEILIIGAGMVGVMTALELARRGKSVCVIDRTDPGMGASFGNAGVVSPWSITPNSMPGLWRKIPGLMTSADRPLSVGMRFWPRMIPWGLRFLTNGTQKQYLRGADAMFALCRPSVALYKRYLQEVGRPDLILDSYYIHAFRDYDPARLAGLDYQVRLDKGADLEWADQKRLQEIEPALGPLYKSAILIKGQARLHSPIKVVRALASSAAARGVKFVKADIQEITQEGGHWMAHATDQAISGKKMVVCAGVWSKRLLKRFEVKLPLVSERGYHLEVPDSKVSLQHSVMDMAAKTVTSSMSDGLRMAGTAEFNDISARPSAWREDLLRRQISAMLPGVRVDKARFWMGQRPSLPDSLPVISAIDPSARIFGAFGHSHHGIMMAPMTGTLMADIVTGRASEIDPAPYDARRFG